jgi:serine O-acetyltransferase
MMRAIVYFFGQLLFLPHVVLFLFSANKTLIIDDIYARKSRKEGWLNHCYYLSLELLISRYFRTLFYFRNNGIVSKLLRIFYPKYPSFTIDMHTKIDGGLQLAHPYATILNAERIGRNVYVNHLVTLGEKDGKKPTIGNNVQLHAGCIIIGGVKIGDNAIIGAGAVVVKDVPENSTAVGNPARILEANKS